MADEIEESLSGQLGDKKSGVKRLRKTATTKPIVYGNIAFPLQHRRGTDEANTHRWTLYLRSPRNEDLSVWIKEVHFLLHSSFAEPTRVITAPPFEVSEQGWGEFDLKIRIHFQDPQEKPLEIFHHLRLRPFVAEGNPPPDPKKPVVAETFDEIIFTEPTESLNALLTQPRFSNRQHPYANYFLIFDETEELEKVNSAQKRIRIELQNIRDQLGRVETEIRTLQ